MLNGSCTENQRFDFSSQPSSYHFAKQPPSVGPAIHGRSKSAPLDDSALPFVDVSTPCYQDWVFIEGDRRKELLDRRRLALEQDVLCLQARLQEEQAIRISLEKALVSASTSISPGRKQISQQTRELIAETALLEYEVAHLEQLVISLYKKLHVQQLRFAVTTPNNVQHAQKKRRLRSMWHKSRSNAFVSAADSPASETRGRFTFSDRLSGFEQSSPKFSKESKASPLHHLLEAIHLKDKQKLSEMPVVEHVGCRPNMMYSNFVGSANELSEQLIRCMAGIYCKLADPPIVQSDLSPAGRFGPGLLMNPFQIKEQLGDAGAYKFMLEVSWICVDKEQLAFAAHALQEFKCLVRKLSSIDVSLMKRDEKLAFWINVYNALVMHAYLAYGIPSSKLKRVSLLQKASYKVGSCSINAHNIEQHILGCRSQSSGQWLQALFSPLSRLKSSDEKRGYGLANYEPLVRFALCSGARSDPSVRVYTAVGIKEQLERAKDEFIQASVGIGNGDKITVPKLIENYAKEAGLILTSSSLLDVICNSLPEGHRSSLEECLAYQRKKRPRSSSSSGSNNWLEWPPFDSSFRYILARDLLPS